MLYQRICFVSLLVSMLFGWSEKALAQSPPDTVKVGIYIISLHDIDFRQKEYTTRFWLWMKYKRKEFDFQKYLEIPNAKSVEIANTFTDSANGEYMVLMKLICVMKESWSVQNYPFDEQKLEIRIENSNFDTRSLFFKPSVSGKHFDPNLTISGWKIEDDSVYTKIRPYETSFGDASVKTPHTEYDSYNVDIVIGRSAGGLFLKLFIGMYVAFLIAFVCYFIHPESIDSRFGLSVGALFAAVGNKYIIDSLLPESTSFTLVDILHALTFVYIFVTILVSVLSMYLQKKGKTKRANKLDRSAAYILGAVYLGMNLYYVMSALYHH